MEIRLQEQIDNQAIHAILASLEEHTGKNCVFLWGKVKSILPETYCGIFHIKDIILQKKIQLIHLETDGNVSFVSFFNIFEFDINYFSFITGGLFISPVKSESRMFADSTRLQRFFSRHLLPEKYDFDEIRNVFQEIYMNICQHSQITKGYIFISEPNDTGETTLYFSDVGIGIVNNIRAFFPHKRVESDKNLIWYALGDYVTTKSTKKNQGRGLYSFIQAVSKLNGKAEICCGNGYISIISNQILPKTLPYNHKGTFISLQFNIHRLEKIDNDDHLSDIDF